MMARKTETAEGRSVRLPFIALLCLAGCSDQRAFDAAAWKADALSDSHQWLEVRRSMIEDLARRFPRGTAKTEVVAQLGPGEEQLDCAYPDADSCLAYDLGVRSIDYDFYEFRFRRDRLVASYVRPT